MSPCDDNRYHNHLIRFLCKEVNWSFLCSESGELCVYGGIIQGVFQGFVCVGLFNLEERKRKGYIKLETGTNGKNNQDLFKSFVSPHTFLFYQERC